MFYAQSRPVMLPRTMYYRNCWHIVSQRLYFTNHIMQSDEFISLLINL